MARSSSPKFVGPSLLWPNSWIDQDATWQEGRPQPRRLCIRWGTSPLPTTGVEPPPQFSAHIYCDQMAGWIKMPLGTMVGFDPSAIVLDGDPAPPLPKRDRALSFRPMSIVTERLHGSRWAQLHLVSDIAIFVLKRDVKLQLTNPAPLPKGHSSPPKFRPMSVVVMHMVQLTSLSPHHLLLH